MLEFNDTQRRVFLFAKAFHCHYNCDSIKNMVKEGKMGGE